MKAIFRIVLGLLVGFGLLAKAQALTCYAITQGNHILTFSSSTPGTLSGDHAISGINSNYSVIGLAIRTTTQPNSSNAGVGSLWGLAMNNSNKTYFLCTIDPSTGVATQVGGLLSLDSTVSASPDAIAFGFDPAADLFRVISVEKNYAVNPNTLTATQQTSFSGFPAQSGAAFAPSSYTGGTSQFYDISRDVNPRELKTSTDVSTGVLSTVGSTMLSNIFAPMGLCFGGSQLYLATDNGDFYTLNTSTGAATSQGTINGNPAIRGLAVVPASYPPVLSQEVKVTVSGKKRVTTTKATAIIKGTASCDFGVSSVKVKVGKAGFKNASGTTSWKFKARLKPGVNVVKVQATGGNGASSSIVTIRIVRK